MAIVRKNIDSYPSVKSHLMTIYGNVDSLNNIPIVSVSKDLWDKFKLVGYGYVVRSGDILQNQTFLELAANNPHYYNTLPTNEHQRDVNIYRIWKKLQSDLFILVLEHPNSEYYIVHELSHIMGVVNRPVMEFDDEYLSDIGEQSSYLNEILYARNKGLTFEQYFEKSFSNEDAIIKAYESGTSTNKNHYELAMADKLDYKTMWDSLGE